MPVPKVDQAALAPPYPDQIEGSGRAIDGDEIKVGDWVVRLYGIAAPDMTARLGPEARVALDDALKGQRVSCTVFGKTESGDALGQCKAGDADPAQSLLAQGLAAVYRSGSTGGDVQMALAQQYDAAEEAARKQAIGLWQVEAAKPTGPDPEQERARRRAEALGTGAFLLLILAIFAVSITRLSVARTDRKERAQERRSALVTLSSGMAAEAEIIRMAAQRTGEYLAAFPGDKPIPGAVSAMLSLPSATYWHANGERLHTLPVAVTIPLLRLHALHEDAARKLAIASAIPNSLVAATLSEVATAADRAIAAIEQSLGIKREKAAEPAKAPAQGAG